MKIGVVLQTKKGEFVLGFDREFPEIHCLSDASQQFGRSVVQHSDGRIFGFHFLSSGGVAFFKGKEIIPCE